MGLKQGASRFDIVQGMRLLSRLPALICGFAVIAALLVLRGYDPPILSALRGAGFDTLQRLWPRDDSVPQPVRIVDQESKRGKGLRAQR